MISFRQRLLLLLNAPAAGFGDRLQLGLLAVAERHRLLALVLQVVVGQHDLRQVDPLALAAELQQRQQALVEDRALLDRRVAVVEDLRQERVEPQKAPMSALNSSSASSSSLRGSRRGRRPSASVGGLQRLLCRLVALHAAGPPPAPRPPPVRSAWRSASVPPRRRDPPRIVVVPGGVQLGAQVVDEIRVGDVRQLRRRRSTS